jgi:hypothetical protein
MLFFEPSNHFTPIKFKTVFKHTKQTSWQVFQSQNIGIGQRTRN